MKPIEPLEQPRLLTESEQGEAKLAAAQVVAELSEKYAARFADDGTLQLRYDSATAFKWPVRVTFDIPYSLVSVDVESDIILESGAEVAAFEFYITRKNFKYKHFTLYTAPVGVSANQEDSWKAGEFIHSRFISPLKAWDTEKIIELPANTLRLCEKELRRAASAHEGPPYDEEPGGDGSLRDLLRMLRSMDD